MRTHRARDTLKSHETTPNFFVPAFAVRRSLEEDDEDFCSFLEFAKKRLGKNYTVYEPERVCLTALERGAFVNSMRNAGQQLRKGETRAIIENVAEGLGRLIEPVEDTLELPVGQIERVGRNKDKLAFFPLGWRGFRKRYPAVDETSGETLPVGQIVMETEWCVGVVASAMSERFHNRHFVGDDLVRTPHITFAARKKGNIQRHELESIRDRLITEGGESKYPECAALADPMIYFQPSRGSGEQQIVVRSTGTNQVLASDLPA